MSFLDTYQAIDVDRTGGPDPLARAKDKLIKGLKRQITMITEPQKLDRIGKPFRQWWFRHSDGLIYTHIRFGTRPMRFATGKSFKVGREEDLVPFYQEAIAAIEAGEFDDIIEKSRVIGAHGRGGRRGRHGHRGTRHAQAASDGQVRDK